MTAKHQEILCPSVPHDWEGARVFAVVGGTVDRPELSYLDQALPVTDEVVRMAAPVAPDEVFRMAGACASHRCVHYTSEDDRCTLVERTVGMTETAVHLLPRCAVRAGCRWWQQEGADACRRCPQVARRDYAADEITHAVATPPNALSY
jgi:hypothetical protein